MRWFFLLLLGINVGYVAWELNREHPQHARTAALAEGVERIVLLRELESEIADKEDSAQAPAPITMQEAAAKPSEDDLVPQQQAAADMAKLQSTRETASLKGAAV